MQLQLIEKKNIIFVCLYRRIKTHLSNITGMIKKQAIQLFQERKVRTVWDDEQEKWYFSIVDVCGVLTDSKNALTARKYWNKLKQRLKEEGNETVTNCHQLKMPAADGKMRLTDVADTESKLGRSIISKAKASDYLLPDDDKEK